jgi:flagellar assembly factor FliW
MLITRTPSDDATLATDAAEAAGGDLLIDGAVLDFGGGIPGFPSSRHFRLETLAPELQPFCVMRSTSETGISFVLVPPGTLFPDYTIEIDEQQVANLELESADDAMVFTIVTLGHSPTANLLGPLVVNRRTRAAAHVVQYQSSYRAAEPLAPVSGA